MFTLPSVVVQGSGPSLLGCNLLQQIKHNWTKIHAVSPNMLLNNLLEKYASLFRSELGCLNIFTTKLFVDSHIKPRFLNFTLSHIYLEKSRKGNSTPSKH